MDLNSFSASKYLAKTDVPAQGLTLTIAGFGIEALNDGTKKPYVSWLEAGVKPLLLNKTNRSRLGAICGTTQTEAMIGKRVNVYNDPMIEMQGQIVGGLRIRPVANVLPPELAQALATQLPAAPVASTLVPGLPPDVQAALDLARQRADQVAQRIAGQPAGDAFNDEIPF